MTHLLPVAGTLKASNLHAPGVLLIFQHSPALPAAPFGPSASCCHEGVPRHIYGLFQALGIQYRWVLTRGSLGHELLDAEDLVIADSKEPSWMAVYEHERDLLEDMYTAALCLYGPSSPTPMPFLTNTDLFCAQQVWEALLAAFGDISRAFDYMGALTIDDVFRSVILATLKSANNRALRTAYDQILTTWTTTRTSHLRTSKPSVPANSCAPRSDTRIHLTAPRPRALRRANRRSNLSSTTSANDKGATTSPSSYATPLNNMVNSLGRFSAEPASLAPSGTSLLQSPPCSWPPRNTSVSTAV